MASVRVIGADVPAAVIFDEAPVIVAFLLLKSLKVAGGCRVLSGFSESNWC